MKENTHSSEPISQIYLLQQVFSDFLLLKARLDVSPGYVTNPVLTHHNIYYCVFHISRIFTVLLFIVVENGK